MAGSEKMNGGQPSENKMIREREVLDFEHDNIL